MLLIVSISFLMKIDRFVTKFEKAWVLAPILVKTVGAIAPTAPILTRALISITYHCTYNEHAPDAKK